MIADQNFYDTCFTIFYPTASATAYGRRPKFFRAEHSATAEGGNCAYGPTLVSKEVSILINGGTPNFKYLTHALWCDVPLHTAELSHGLPHLLPTSLMFNRKNWTTNKGRRGVVVVSHIAPPLFFSSKANNFKKWAIIGKLGMISLLLNIK